MQKRKEFTPCQQPEIRVRESHSSIPIFIRSISKLETNCVAKEKFRSSRKLKFLKPAVKRLAARAGISKRISPHTVRRLASITAALDAGVPLHDVQEAAPHADPANHDPLRPPRRTRRDQSPPDLSFQSGTSRTTRHREVRLACLAQLDVALAIVTPAASVTRP